jgi:hypothetical protein
MTREAMLSALERVSGDLNLWRPTGEHTLETGCRDRVQWNVERLIAALRETPAAAAPAVPSHEARGWREIETAPKDGTVILLWRDGWDSAPVAWGDHDVECADGVFFGWQLKDESLCLPNAVQEGFIGWNEDKDADAMPTHWMPLPESPK